MSQEEMERMRAMVRNVLQASEALRIAQDDSTVMVVAAEGVLRIHHPDGRKKSYPVQGVGNVESRAKWDDDKLVIELRMDGGVRAPEPTSSTRRIVNCTSGCAWRVASCSGRWTCGASTILSRRGVRAEAR